MICEKCKTTVSETAKFCPKCGAKIEAVESPKDVKICPKCGMPNPLTAKFCKKDGTPLKEEVMPVETKETEVKPETVAEPKTEDMTIEAKQEEKPPEPEKLLEVEEPKDIIICPTCGTQNPLTAKFCKKDGTPLKDEPKPVEMPEKGIEPAVAVQPKIKEAVSSVADVKEEPIKKPSRLWIWMAISGLILTIAGAGSYLYFSGFLGKSPSKIQEKINTELREKGLINVIAEVSKDWIATVGGSVSEQSYKDEALSLVKKHEEIKDVIDNIQVQRPLSDLEAEINNTLKDQGLTDIYAQVGPDLIATLKGSANSQDEKDKAINIARMNREIKDVRDEIQLAMIEPPSAPMPAPTPERVPEPAPVPSPAPPPLVTPAPTMKPSHRINPFILEREINRELRIAGLRRVRAEVGEDLSVTLKGAVRNAFDKDRAFEIAKSFQNRGVRRIRDMIFVVKR